MKLHDMMEEMGQAGLDQIRKNLYRLAKKLRLSPSDFDVSQEGAVFVIFKNGKKFANIPLNKGLDTNYLTSVLKDEM